jgi:hypothetical protein
MTTSRRVALAITAAALLGGPAAATAAAAPLVVDRFEAADDTAFVLSARASLAGGEGPAARAVFRLDADAPEGSSSPYATQEEQVSRARLRLAGRRLLVVGSALACGRPGATAVYGTVVRRAARVVARLQGGRRVRLSRKRAPRAWDYDGWVVGAVVGVRRPVTAVDAFNAAGDRIARAAFDAPQDCG